MTFYWWSHWFWITALGALLLHKHFVQTYPSQDISSEYNNRDMQTLKPVTKLYQATTITFTWENKGILQSTTVQPLTNGDRTKLLQVTPVLNMWSTLTPEFEDEFVEPHDEFDTDIDIDVNADTDTNTDADADIVNTDDDNSSDETYTLPDGVIEYKRSAELLNKTNEATQQLSPTAVPRDYAIPDNPINSNSTNYTHNRTLIQATTTNATDISERNTNQSLAALPVPAIPSSPRIDSANVTQGWLSVLPTQSNQVTVYDTDSSSNNLNGVAGHKAPFTLENVNKEDELRRAEMEHRTRKSKGLSAEYRHRVIGYSTDSKNLLARSTSSTNEFDGGESNISSEALSIQRAYFLDAGAISAICFTIFGVCCTLATVGIVLYRRRYLNKPQALSEPDSSVYIDDSTLRDNSDEMYSLDNDSFLNSLEAMTIQNYWTDTVKHTKL